MNLQKITLPVGIEYEGALHRDVQLQPAKVRHTIDAYDDTRGRENDLYYGLLVLCKRITKLGDIPLAKVTPELLMDALQVDLDAIYGGAKLQNNSLGGFLQSATDKATTHTQGGAGQGGALVD